MEDLNSDELNKYKFDEDFLEAKNASSTDQLLTDVGQTLKERIFHPVVLSYLISWLIVNWKFWMFILFADFSVEYKLDYYTDYFDWSGWFWPFLGVALYYTLPNKIQYELMKFNENETKKRIDLMRDEEIHKHRAKAKVAYEKLQALRTQIQADDYKRVLVEHSQQAEKLVELNKKNEELQKVNSKSLSENTRLINQLNQIQDELKISKREVNENGDMEELVSLIDDVVKKGFHGIIIDLLNVDKLENKEFLSSIKSVHFNYLFSKGVIDENGMLTLNGRVLATLLERIYPHRKRGFKIEE